MKFLPILSPPFPSLLRETDGFDNYEEGTLDQNSISIESGCHQVWSLTQFYSVDFTQSRIGVKKCVFNKRTIKVCVSCS